MIHPKLKKLFGDILDISQGPPIDMAEKLHRFGTGQVSEQLMGKALDDDVVGMLAENETNICKKCHDLTLESFAMAVTYVSIQSVNEPLGRRLAIISQSCVLLAE